MAKTKSKKKRIITLSIFGAILIAVIIVGIIHVSNYEKKHSWTDIVQISAGNGRAVGLREDGSVVVTGEDKAIFNKADFGGFVSVESGQNVTYGIRKNGTVEEMKSVFACSHPGATKKWTDIVDIADAGSFVAGLRKDGTVVLSEGNHYDEQPATTWTNIVEIEAGDNHLVGLKKDGTVVAVGYNYNGQCEVSEWTDIVQISTYYRHTVGLKSDGTVVSTGYDEFAQCRVSGWHDIVDVAAGNMYTIGLRSDGTLVTAGVNSYGACNVSDWKNIVDIDTSNGLTIGLKKDGTVVSTGDNRTGQCQTDEDISFFEDVKRKLPFELPFDK